MSEITVQRVKSRDFPGSPVVKTLHSQCRGTGLIPGPGTKTRHAGTKNTPKQKVKSEWKHD